MLHLFRIFHRRESPRPVGRARSILLLPTKLCRQMLRLVQRLYFCPCQILERIFGCLVQVVLTYSPYFGGHPATKPLCNCSRIAGMGLWKLIRVSTRRSERGVSLRVSCRVERGSGRSCMVCGSAGCWRKHWAQAWWKYLKPAAWDQAFDVCNVQLDEADRIQDRDCALNET